MNGRRWLFPLCLFFSGSLHGLLYWSLAGSRGEDFATPDHSITIQVEQPNSTRGSRAAPRSSPPKETPASPAATTPSPAADNPTTEIGAPQETAGTALGIRPHYPKLSRMMGEEGTVTIEASPSGATVVESSGFGRLDEAALAAVTHALEEKILTASAPPARIKFRFALTKTDAEGAAVQEETH